MKVFLVVFFKFHEKGSDWGFERTHFETFSMDLELAKEWALGNFCDEAGWYEGVFIEEQEERNSVFKGKRVWFQLNRAKGALEEIPEPKPFNNCIHLF